MTNHILLIDCADRRGLVHEVAGVLLNHGCNIIANSEFVEKESSRFFMRTEFSDADDLGSIVYDIRAILPDGASVRCTAVHPRRVVVLVTREHHALGELLIRHACGDLGATISAVIGNHETLAALVRRFDIPFHTVSHAGLSREEHEARMLEAIAPYQPEFIVLAKYMRVLSPAFIAQRPVPIVNIHHSFLPAFVGANPYRQAFERGVKIIGATAHFVTEELDNGPIIAQDVVAVDHTHGPVEMSRAGRNVEKMVLARALQLVFEERVFVHGNRTVIFE